MRYVSALVTQGSGVLGNMVVEKNGVIRNRNIPANPNSPLQAAVRATLASFSTRWRDVLTESQRTGWNAYAATVVRHDALGKTLKLSGIDTYVAGNSAGNLFGAAVVDGAPTLPGGLTLPAVTTIVFDASADTVTVTFAADIPNTTSVNFFMSPGVVSNGRSVYSGPYRYLASADGSGTPTLVFNGAVIDAAALKYGWRLAAVDGQARVSTSQSGLAISVA